MEQKDGQAAAPAAMECGGNNEMLPPPSYPTVMGGMYPVLPPVGATGHHQPPMMPYPPAGPYCPATGEYMLPPPPALEGEQPPCGQQPMMFPVGAPRPLFNMATGGFAEQMGARQSVLGRYSRLLVRLARFMIFPALVIVGLGVATTIMVGKNPHLGIYCTRPSARIWIGALGLVAGLSGLKAARNLAMASSEFCPASRRTTISFFILCVCMAICDGSLILMVTQSVMRETEDLRYIRFGFGSFGPGPAADTARLLLAAAIMESVTAIAALAHMIASIVASSFVCGLWCNNQTSTSSPVTVIYIHPEAVSTVRRLAAVGPCQQQQQNQVYFVATQVNGNPISLSQAKGC